jgi:hypothetical protein
LITSVEIFRTSTNKWCQPSEELALDSALEAPVASRRSKNLSPLLATSIMLIMAAVLLFTHVGHYALWDDEANTALIAQGICQTGDTSALVGHNVVAYEGGWELKHLRERYIPPLPAYLTALSFSLLGPTTLAARLPFALCGLGFFALAGLWLYRDSTDPWTWGLTTFALLTNVSLILYFRQCRYYGVTLLGTALLAYLYLHWTQGRRQQLLLFVAALALLGSNYISFGAAACCVGIDWCIWGHREVRLKAANALVLAGAIAVAAALLLWIFNPFATAPPDAAAHQPRKLLQAWWNIRDMSVNEFCIVPLIMLVPIIAVLRRDLWLLRGGVALLVYFAAVDLVEPHHGAFPAAEVRYLAPIIPLCCVLEVRALLLAMKCRPALATLVAVPILGTNILSGGTMFHSGVVTTPLRSTFLCYLRELKTPPPDPYRAVSGWINTNLPPDASILVLPQYATYPLMFHSPQEVYAWQLNYPPSSQFKSFPKINFNGLAAPRYILIFGRDGLAKFRPIRLIDGTLVHYVQLKSLPIIGKDLFRPELFSRIFAPIDFDVERDGVFVFRKA